MNGKHRNKHIYQIVAIILCITTLATSGVLHNFSNIFATDNANQSQEVSTEEFTWRETTAERGLYSAKFDAPFIMGQEWAGETIDELIQMYNDPSVEIYVEKMFQGTIYEGLSIEDFEFLKEEGYNDLVALANEVGFSGKTSLMEYLFGISTYDDALGAHVTDMYADAEEWGGLFELDCYLPSTGKSYITSSGYYQAKPWSILGVGDKPALCMDAGKRYSSGQTFTAVDVSGANQKIQNATRWLANDFEKDSSSWKTKYKYAQLFIWAVGASSSQTAAQLESRWRELYCEYWTSLWLINNGKVYTVTVDGQSITAFKKSEYDEVLEIAKANDVVLDRMDTWYPIMTGYSESPLRELFVYHNGDANWQRLITWQTPLPPPTTEEIVPETDTEIIRNRLYVQHNITGSITANGEGIIGSWTAPWGTTTYSNNPTTWVCVCGTTTGCSHTTTTDDFYTKAEFEADLSPFSSNHYFTSGSATHNFVDVVYHEDPWEDIIKTPSHYYTEATYETYNEHYCTPTAEHSIYEPVIENYTLTLHYQGGYYNGESDTQYMNGNTYGKTFNNTRTDGYAIDAITTETTQVVFSSMSIRESFKLNYTTSAQPAYGPAGTLEGSSGTRNFVHGYNDGVASLVEFTYKNSYVVSLPTPVRTGYNFLGWFDAPEDGNQIIPTTVTNKDGTFNNAYVISEDKTFYAHWELITKDETFTIEWLDNSNNYTTRPSAVYIELYRYPVGYPEEVDLCKGYITERLYTSTADWINNFSNETGISNKGDSAASTNKTDGIFDPNEYVYDYSTDTKTANQFNDIFKVSSNKYWIKVSVDDLVDADGNIIVNENTGDYENPANSNTWTFVLKDLQKFDTGKEDWIEYQYVIKEVVCESLDNTTQYYTSPNSAHDTYNTTLDNYYNIKNNRTNNSGQMKLSQYNVLDIPTNFSHTIVNRAANVSQPEAWKNIMVTINFEDGPIDNFDDDIYHFRPYEMKIELYQNYAFGKDENSDNYLTDRGVRVLYDTVTVTQPTDAYSATIPAQGFMANTLYHTFENVPTVQDSTCIKIAYDVVLTHGQDRYRYTIDTDSLANNLSDDIVSSHYYANKHETDMKTVTDLDYTKMYNEKTDEYITVLPYTEDGLASIEKSDVLNYWNNGYVFEKGNLNDIYQSILKQEDLELVVNKQNNRYNDNTVAYKASYPNVYQSMAYNMRYYYIDEECYMRATPVYDIAPIATPAEKQTEYLTFKETLHWNFTLTLNDSRTKLPTEYSGSASSDDRTGVYNGGTNDDYMHTKNTLVISNKIYADKAQTSEVNKYGTTSTNNKYDYYDNLITEAANESFLITLKQVQKSWDNSGHDTTESYNDSKYSKNGYKSTSYNDANGNMTINFVSNASADASNFNEYEEIGNEYNIQLPAHGTVIIDYIPDGRYEVTCHYDIDFDYYTMTMLNGTVKFEQGGNEKWYITISSTPETSTGDFLHKATIDYWRGYVDDENQILSYKTTMKLSDKNSWLGTDRNGFNVKENLDEEHPDSFYEDYVESGYKTGN